MISRATIAMLLILGLTGCSMLPMSRETTAQQADTQRRAAEASATMRGARDVVRDVQARQDRIYDATDTALSQVSPPDVAAKMPAAKVLSITIPPLKLARYEARQTTDQLAGADSALREAQKLTGKNVSANRAKWRLDGWVPWVVLIVITIALGGGPILVIVLKRARDTTITLARMARDSITPNEDFPDSIRKRM